MAWDLPLLAHLDPGDADALRDVLALFHADLTGDEAGIDAILAALDAGQARHRLRIMTCMTAGLLGESDPARIQRFIRESGLAAS